LVPVVVPTDSPVTTLNTLNLRQWYKLGDVVGHVVSNLNLEVVPNCPRFGVILPCWIQFVLHGKDGAYFDAIFGRVLNSCLIIEGRVSLKSYFGNIVSKSAGFAIVPPIIIETFVTDMTAVLVDDGWEKSRVMGPGLPTHCTSVTGLVRHLVHTGIPAGTETASTIGDIGVVFKSQQARITLSHWFKMRGALRTISPRPTFLTETLTITVHTGTTSTMYSTQAVLAGLSKLCVQTIARCQ
jgi:hypothetical protein